MPARTGVAVQNQNQLNPAQHAVLDAVQNTEGWNAGISTTYHEVLRRMGQHAAPSRRLVGDYLSTKPGWQMNQIPRAPLTVAPIIPRLDPQTGHAVPLSLVVIDTFFVPPSTYRGEPGQANARNAKLNVWRSAVLVQCALTKYCYVRPCRLRAALDQNDARPHSETARDALIEFRRRARVESQQPALQIKRLLSDFGSEFLAACQTWINNEGIEHVKVVASKSKSNGMAESSLKQWRRLLVGDYKAYKRRWEANNTPQAQRVYNWVDRCDEITRRFNQKRHTTIKAPAIDAIRPGQPSYDECLERIYEYARKRYGNRAVDLPQEGQVGPAILAVGTLVRTVKRKTNSMGRLTWDKIGKTSADNWSEQVYRVRTVHAARGWTLTTYEIEELDGTAKVGKWDRNQLLPISNATPGIMTDSEDDDDDAGGGDDDGDGDDGDDHAAAVAAAHANPVRPRPRVAANVHRYEEGGTLMFAEGWDHEPAIPGGRRAREGIVTDAYFAQVGGQANVPAYTVRFMLQNGRQVSRDYEAKPLPRNQGGDPEQAVDTSRFVTYVHS